MYGKNMEKIFVVDDETYTPANPAKINVREFYHANDPSKALYNHIVKEKTEFLQKYPVWMAITSDGEICEPFTNNTRKHAINAEIYRRDCLKKRLIPFMRLHPKSDKLLF